MHTFFVVLERRERFRRGTHNFRPQLYATHQTARPTYLVVPVSVVMGVRT